MKRIIIVQYNWPLQSFTSLIASAFSKDFKVILFIDENSFNCGTVDTSFFQHDNIKLVLHQKRYPSKVIARLGYYLSAIRIRIGRYTGLFKFLEIRKARIELRKIAHSDDIIIAVEKEGLVISSLIKNKKKLIYYSLELYQNAHSKRKDYKYIRCAELKSLQSVNKLIIQDKMRRNVLNCESYWKTFDDTNSFYLPVSLKYDTTPKLSYKYWHKKFNLHEDTKIILYFGHIRENTRGLELLVYDQIFKRKDLALIIHGDGDLEFIRKLRLISMDKNIFFSTDTVIESQVPDLINASDIGCCWYSSVDSNNEHTAFSSEKIALFLRAGKPIFTNYSKTYKFLYSGYKCGFGSTEISEFSLFLLAIIEDYSNMSQQALSAFEAYYNFEKNILNLEKYFCELF